jgi:hypothetical protein
MKGNILYITCMILIFCLIGTVSAASGETTRAHNELNLPENAVEVSPGVFYLGKSMDKGKVVEGYAFVHYAKDSNKVTKAKPARDDTFDKYKFLFPSVEFKWANTMKYEVDPDNSSLDSEDVITVLGDSLNTWNVAITKINPSFKLFDSPDYLTTEQNPGENDNHNIVVWRDLGSGGTIAYNSLWFNTASMAIVDSDVVFNTEYTWSVDNTCTGEKMDLQSLATHEFGHNGLGDLYSPPSVELTMHGISYGYCETKKRDLGNGDELGIQALYGE